MAKEINKNSEEELDAALEGELLETELEEAYGVSENDGDTENEAEVNLAFDATAEELADLLAKEGLSETLSEEEAQQEIFVQEDQLQSLLESILFANPKPLTFDAFKQIFKGTNIKTKQLRKALEEYAQSLADSSRGVYLEEVAGGFQLRTKLENTEFLKNAVKQRPFKVSGPSLEVLAIIAYKQPCIKAEVDTIRGVESGHLVRVLMDKGLVAFDGKSDLPGKPMLYKTTKKFLEVFGLRNIRELPSFEEIEQLIPEGIEPKTEEKKTLDSLTGELSLDYARRDQEAEEELVKISDQLSVITTTSDYFEQEKERQRQQRDKDRADDIRERILLGQEEVEDKDIKWLKRYEEKLMAPVEEAPVVAAVTDAVTAENASSVEEVISTEESVSVSSETSETIVSKDEAEKELVETIEALTSEEEKIVIETAEEGAKATPSAETRIGSLAEAAKSANALFDDEDDSANKVEI